MVALSWFVKSKEAIITTMNTVYPGERFYTGGNDLAYLMYYINNLVLPYTKVGNSCEAAMAWGFFPFTEIIVTLYLIKSRKKDMLLTLLLGLDVFFIFYLCVGVPELVAKLSLLYLTSERLAPIVCIIEIVMYIRLMSLSDDAIFPRKRHNLVAIILFSGLVVAFAMAGKECIPSELNPETGLKNWYLGLIIFLMCGFCLMFFTHRSERGKKHLPVLPLLFHC